MPNTPRFGFVLEYVADIAAATRFYVDILGFTVAREHPAFVQFTDSAGATFAIASDESLSGQGERELYWLVEDAEAAFSEIASRAEVSLPITRKPFGKVFGIIGPAGQPCYLLEFARDRPSQSVR